MNKISQESSAAITKVIPTTSQVMFAWKVDTPDTQAWEGLVKHSDGTHEVVTVNCPKED